MSNTRNDIAKRLGLAQPKTKMGRAEKVMTDGSVHLDFKEAKEWLSSVSDDSLKYIISDANAAAKAMGADGKKFNYYTDLALTAGQILRSTKRGGHRLNSSRPGAKATMATPMRVALTPMHTRAEQGYENFISNLMKLGGVTREQAQKAFKAYKDAKVLVTKEQYRGGGITVKHGAFMERDVIRRAAGLAEESSRTGAKGI